ncbi:MAG TPA: TIGR02300 family protein [Dongiaceae bacterium]|jgi:uncharacterized protein (TIGR02300 family)|nr:TIGR02300 family protein [Dongiaceae bacterium]
MSKLEWGLKRLCQNCGAHFYDMRRNPIECPKCNAVFDPEALLKSKRTQRVAAEPKPEPKAEPLGEVDIESSDDDAVIEDTSELGDDEDVSGVIEDIGEEEP